MAGRAAPQDAARLTGLRLVIVALSLTGLVTAYSAIELFRFGGLTTALRETIATSQMRQDDLTALAAALEGRAADTDGTAALARIAGWTDPPALQAQNRDRLLALADAGPARAEAAALTRRMADLETAETRRIQSLWGEASREISRVLSMTLAAIVVLIATVVLRSLAYLHLRDRTEGTLRAAGEAARRANAAKSEFLATVSHELRTPLTGVLGYADLLAASDPRPDQRPRIDRLREAGQTLSALIDDLLDLSRIEAGRIAILPAPFDLPALLDHVTALVAPVAAGKGLRLTLEPAPDLPRAVSGDARRITQVLLNLLNNAVKFTDAGSVTLNARPEGDTIAFAVTDTGIGIAEADLPRLFRRFGQIDGSNSRSHGGTGLGLAISRGLAEAMGGSVTVTSREGAGSTFTLRLPLPEADLAETDPPSPGGPAPHHPARVLVVEDSAQNRDIVRALLEGAGHRVREAADGIDGLRAAAEDRFDLIVMDMQMPRMDGPAATAAIRALPPPHGRVPVLALTANVLPDQIAAIRAAGADAHLGKPFTGQGLLAACHALLAAAPRTGVDPQDRDLPDNRSERVFDEDAFDELAALLGPDWVAARLDGLIDGLGWIEAGTGDLGEIRRLSHRLVSDAGQLGLTALSGGAMAVEQAIRAGQDPQAAIAALARAAVSARAILPDLRARLGRDHPAPRLP